MSQLPAPQGRTVEPTDVLEFGMALVAATPAFRARVERLPAPRGDARALVQASLSKAWRERSHFPGDGPREAWLQTILRRQVLQ